MEPEWAAYRFTYPLVMNKTKVKVYREGMFLKTLKGQKTLSNNEQKKNVIERKSVEEVFYFLNISCDFSVIACC